MDQTTTYPYPKIDDYAKKRGVCLLGETGTGVTYTLSMYMKDDVAAGKRLLLIDPFGELLSKMQEQHPDTKVWKVGANESPYFIDLFSNNSNMDSFQKAEEIIDLMYMLFDPYRNGVIGPRFEHAIRNTIVALIDTGQGSLLNVVKMLTDTNYLQSIIPSIKHEGVKIYFNEQLKQTSDFHKSEVLDYIVSKLSVFVEPTSFIGNITNSSNRESFMHVIINTKQTLGVDLSYLRKQPAHLQNIAIRLLLKQLSHLMKDNNENLNNMVFYIDEADKFYNEHLNDLIVYARKNDAEVVYTVRSISQASPEVQYSFLASKTIISYRVPPPDAKILAQYFEGFKSATELSNLPNFKCLIRERTKEGVALKES